MSANGKIQNGRFFLESVHGDATHYHENRMAQADRIDSMCNKSIKYNASVAWLQLLSKLLTVQNNHDGAKIALNIVDYINELEDNTTRYVTTIETLVHENVEVLTKIIALKARVPVMYEYVFGHEGNWKADWQCPVCEGTGITWEDDEG